MPTASTEHSRGTVAWVASARMHITCQRILERILDGANPAFEVMS